MTNWLCHNRRSRSLALSHHLPVTAYVFDTSKQSQGMQFHASRDPDAMCATVLRAPTPCVHTLAVARRDDYHCQQAMPMIILSVSQELCFLVFVDFRDSATELAWSSALDWLCPAKQSSASILSVVTSASYRDEDETIAVVTLAVISSLN